MEMLQVCSDRWLWCGMVLTFSPCSRRHCRDWAAQCSASTLTGTDLAPVSIEGLSIEQLSFSRNGLRQGREVYTLLHHSQKIAAGLMILSSLQQHALTGLVAFPRLVIISALRRKKKKKKKKQQHQLSDC